MNRTLSQPERVAWLQLARTPRIGPLTFHRLVARFGGAAAALEALPRLGDHNPPPRERIYAELEALDDMGAVLLASCEPAYPALLAQLDAPPPALAVRGDAAHLKTKAIALVGSREGSAAALLFAERLAADLGASGFTVVSGLARGVDAAAHRGALKTGTVAVLAGGLDHPYPPQNLQLHDAICAHGCVVSEAPLGAVARGRDFPRRNSIISGLSRAVIVVEAALRSGSLITARAAADQGRDVMATPGSPLDPRARGSNALIKQGATLVESAEDVIAALGNVEAPLRPLSTGPLFDDAPVSAKQTSALAERIAGLLSPTPVHVNDLARLLAAPSGLVAAALTELELDGRAASLPGGYAASSVAAFRAPD
ncbi:MAG: DNA-processing protein DprA [Hyphomonadaceae bacterium]|nr:DNA-processing protein DprA [Hyphomonadaceae bacterium]